MKFKKYWYNIEIEFNLKDKLYIESEKLTLEDKLYIESEKLITKVCSWCLKSMPHKIHNNPKGLCVSCTTQNNNITKHLS